MPEPIAPDHGERSGAACGVVVLDADSAEQRGKAGESVILVRSETAAADIHGLIQAKGIVTAFGGITSHAAVVAREWASRAWRASPTS